MKNKFNLLKSRLLQKTLKILGLCAGCFLIEACYGTPQSEYNDMPKKDFDIQGSVVLKDSKIPCVNTEVLLTQGRYNDTIHTFTDNKGNFIFEDIGYSEDNYHISIKQKTTQTFDFKVTEKELLANCKELNYQVNN